MLLRKTSLLVLTGLSTLLACGEMGDDEKTPPLVVIEGQLNQASLSGQMPANVRVALVWMTSSENFKSSHDIAVTPVFPSKFRLEVKDPPPASAIKRPGTDEEVDPTQDLPKEIGKQNVRSNEAYAVGTIVAYEDLNGNGKLDLISADQAPLDRIVGTNEHLTVVYVEGAAPANLFGMREAPVPGYNLLDRVGCRKAPGDAPAPPCPEPKWLPITTLYHLPLSDDPQLAEMMCGSTGSTLEAQASQSNVKPGEAVPIGPGPNGWPKKDEQGLICEVDGQSYRLVRCTTTSLGLCKGARQQCSEERYRAPDPVPAEFPCSK